MGRIRKNEPGFTLIETLMVIVVLGIAATGILLYFINIGKAGAQGRAIEAVMLAEERIEQIIAQKKGNGFSTVALANPATTDSAFSPPFDAFTRTVEVYCVNEAGLDMDNGDTSASCPGSDISAKRVKVTVSWTGGAVDLATVLSNH